MNTRIGLIRCEHCGRQFNPHSAARHIPWCAKQKSDSKKHALSHEKRQALERYKWRIGYRPSNQIQQQQQQQQQHHRAIPSSSGYKNSSHFNNNSTGTHSSPSASSSASAGGASSVYSNGGDGRGGRLRGATVKQQQIHNNTPQQIRHTITSRPARSISSLSLSGHQQALAAGGGSRSLRKSDSQDTVEVHGAGAGAGRAKSVNDVSCDMSSIVESLAKRMDEIYKQNQLLLATLSMANLNRKSAPEKHHGDDLDGDDDDDDERGTAGSESPNSDSEQSKCHHCRAEYLPEAVYCHKCGCKLFESASSRSATPG